MSKSRPIETDAILRVRRMFHDSIDGESQVVEHTQDVSAILKENKEQYKAYDERSRWNHEMNRVASIPLVVWEDLKRRGIADDKNALMRWLDDPDNRAFRTRPGRVS